MKFPGLPLQLPLFIACPWCQFLTCRIRWKGILKYPRKNFFLIWILDSIRGENVRERPCIDEIETNPSIDGFVSSPRVRPSSTNTIVTALRPRHVRVALQQQQPQQRTTRDNILEAVHPNWEENQLPQRLPRIISFFLQVPAKLPLVFLFMFIFCYVIPFCTLILAIYSVCTIFFALPCALLVYFSVPSLGWLLREIVTR